MLQILDDLWRDLDRLSRMGAGPRQIALDAGAWAIATYRLERLLRQTRLRALVKPLSLAVRALTGVRLSVDAEIGGGLYLAHTGQITVAAGARIGRDCNLSRGASVLARSEGAPLIGDRVYVGPGARIVGPVRVGNDAAVGAHAVVAADVPDRGVAGGPPSRIVHLHTRVLPGRRRPPLGDQLRDFLRAVLPRPTQLLLRAG